MAAHPFASSPAVLHRRWFSSANRSGAASAAFASKNGENNSISFGDQLLDYIEGGPKLRKWYGAEDTRNEKDVANERDDQEEEERRDAVLVTDADSETGQLVVLSLILKRCRARLLVRDAKIAAAAFGPYVEPVVGNVEDRTSVIKACKGVRAIICVGKLGVLSDKTLLKGVEHIVYLSEVASLKRNGGSLEFMLRAGARARAVSQEFKVAALGIPCTILRPSCLRDQPGGRLGLDINKVELSSTAQVQNGNPTQPEMEPSISRQDAAMLCVKALDALPRQTLVLEVTNNAKSTTDVEAVFSSFT